MALFSEKGRPSSFSKAIAAPDAGAPRSMPRSLATAPRSMRSGSPGPEPEGKGAALSMTAALREAHIDPSEVDYINAHGTSTKLNDLMETVAVKRVFGHRAASIPMSSQKSMIGHLIGASGAVEAAATAISLHRGVVPPTINLATPDPGCDLDYVPNTSREMPLETAVSNSFGFGGQNATLVMTRV